MIKLLAVVGFIAIGACFGFVLAAFMVTGKRGDK